MIENKEEYEAKTKELVMEMTEKFDAISNVEDLQSTFGSDAKLCDIKKRLEDEARQVIQKHDEFTKEVRDNLTAIVNKYSIGEILCFTTNGGDLIDLSNAYASGKI